MEAKNKYYIVIDRFHEIEYIPHYKTLKQAQERLLNVRQIRKEYNSAYDLDIIEIETEKLIDATKPIGIFTR